MWRSCGNTIALMLGLTIMSYKDSESALQYLHEAETLANMWRDTRAKCAIYPALAFSHAQEGDLVLAREHHLRAFELAMSLGAALRAGMTLVSLTEVLLMLEQWDDAEQYVRQAVEVGADSWPFLKGIADGMLAVLAIQDGRLQDADRLLDAAEALAESSRHVSETAKIMTVRAIWLSTQDRQVEAEEKRQCVVSSLENISPHEAYQGWLLAQYERVASGVQDVN